MEGRNARIPVWVSVDSKQSDGAAEGRARISDEILKFNDGQRYTGVFEPAQDIPSPSTRTGLTVDVGAGDFRAEQTLELVLPVVRLRLHRGAESCIRNDSVAAIADEID